MGPGQRNAFNVFLIHIEGREVTLHGSNTFGNEWELSCPSHKITDDKITLICLRTIANVRNWVHAHIQFYIGGCCFSANLAVQQQTAANQDFSLPLA